MLQYRQSSTFTADISQFLLKIEIDKLGCFHVD